jgi:hypothetical protein
MGCRLPEVNEGSMLTTRVRILLVCSMSAVLSACSSSPTTPTPARAGQPVTVMLVQGTSTAISGAPVRLAFDAVIEPCNDTAASCVPSARPWTQFRVQVEGGAFQPLPLERLGTELRFQGSAGGYLFLVDRLRVQQPGEWVATVVVRRGLEL